jgi:hypothetical protein
MTARQDTNEIQRNLERRGIALPFSEVNTLRRAELTLHRWAELECGDGNDYGSWAIERDETTGKPYMVRHHYRHGAGKNTVSRTRIPDREAGALKRVAAICKEHGLHFYHQTDPRGCALYINNEPMPDFNYNRGVAVC